MINNIHRIFLIATLLTLSLTGFAYATTTTPPTTTQAPVLNAAQLSVTEGTAHGTEIGKVEGAEAGLQDQRNGLSSTWSRSIPASTTLVTRYRLSLDNYGYQNAFIAAYRAAYEIAYNEAFRKASMTSYTTVLVSAQAHAATLAAPEASFMASFDIVRNRNNSWSRAYDEWILKNPIEKRYRLDREGEDYTSTFKETFIDTFRKTYIKAFEDLNANIEAKNSNFTLVTMNESSIQVEKVYGEVSSGAYGEKTYVPATLKIPKGAVYQDTYIGLHHIQNSMGAVSSPYEPVSHSVRITIANSSGTAKLNAPLTLNMPYTGSARVGIYEFKYGKWIYMPSEQVADGVTMTIPPGQYSGGQYALFIDEAYKVPKDLNFNWASKDILVSLRRGHIASSDFFRPNDAMTRAEFADILYRTLVYRSSTPTNTLVIADQAKLGSYGDAVKFAVNARFMSLDAKKRFNPSAYITYKEAETVLSNILLYNFKFDVVSSRMLYERYYRSGYLMNNNGLIKRAEVVFMLNEYLK